MLFIVGFITVIVCIIVGYTAHGGNLGVLWQPYEVLIICGAAIGAFLISNPGKVAKDVLKSLKLLMKGSPYKKMDYVELLTMLFAVLRSIRAKGLLEIESQIEDPYNSEMFSSYPKFLSNHHAVDFFCDYVRIMTMGVEDHYQMEDLMDKDLEGMEVEHHHIAHAVTNMGDGLPALGIVAAVLGVINTMGSIDQPPAVLGKLIGAALVGTFLGVLLSYGFVSPIGNYLNGYFADERKYIECIKIALIAHLKGNAPVISVEMARNSIMLHERPSFQEIEEAVQNIPTG